MAGLPEMQNFSDQIQIGDIITFDSHLSFGTVAHRAVEVYVDHDTYFIYTKGDNIDQRDPWTVTDEDQIGKVIEIIPKIGFVMAGPIKYSLIAVIAITGFFLIKESFESKTKN